VARRQLLTDGERRLLFGVPEEPDALTRHYSLTRSDLELLAERRGDANRLGFVVQLALLRHPGIALASMEEPVAALVTWLAELLEISASAFADYSSREQTMSDHARMLAAAMGLRPAAASDLPFMIEAAAKAAWSTDRGLPAATGIITALRAEKVILPAPAVIERAAMAGRARARKRAAEALLKDVSEAQLEKLEALLVVEQDLKATPLAWLRNASRSPKADNAVQLVDRLRFLRNIGMMPEARTRVHEDRFEQFVREARISDAHQLRRYATHRRRAILAASVIDLEARLTDALLDMADKLIGGMFARARRTKERRYVSSARDVSRLMRLFDGTIDALEASRKTQRDGFVVVDEKVGWTKLQRARGDVRSLADLVEEDPLLGAADRYMTLRRFAPELLEALEFKAARTGDPMLTALRLLRDLNKSGRRGVPEDAPMPFRKEWKRLVTAEGAPNRRLYETAVFAALRDKLRSGDVWVDRSANYRRFDNYLLPMDQVPAIATELGLPGTADEWLARRGNELDARLKRFVRNLRRGQLEGVELRDGRLHVTPVKAATPPEAGALAARIDGMLPPVRITEILHEVAQSTGLASAFTNLRTGEQCDNENALLAAILADATNLGLTRMAAASHGVTRDQLIWTAGAYIRPETYKAALAKIIDAHRLLPVARIWGDGTTSSSDGQFFRSGKRGDAAGDINARYGRDPGVSFYTHLSDQHGSFSSVVMSATNHEAPYVLDGLLHNGTRLAISTHYTDTGGATDHVFILCAMLGIRFCPRLRDLPDRRLACIEPANHYPDLRPLMGTRVKTGIVRDHWVDVVRLAASLKAGTVAPSAMLKKLSAYRRQNQLDLALQELGRVERTLFMLDWLESPALRRRCHAGLNKSEQRHYLAQEICTFSQGRIADRDAEAQQFRASGLNLVIAAIAYWNSTYMADAINYLRSRTPVPDALLTHTSPLTWEHISFSGDFLWENAAASASARRPLNLRSAEAAA
jgi:TnpA family transposase